MTGPATLEKMAAVWPDLCLANSAAVNDYADAVRDAVNSMSSVWTDPTAEIAQIDAATERLSAEYQRRFGHGSTAVLHFSEPLPALQAWCDAVHHVADVINRTTFFPLKKAQRNQAEAAISHQVQNILAERDLQHRAAFAAEHDRMIRTGTSRLQTVFAERVSGYRRPTVQGLDPVDTADRCDGMESGPGRLRFSVGVLRPRTLVVRSRRLEETITTEVPLADAPGLHAVVDLERDGGLVTEWPQAIQTLVVQALALVAPGQLRLDVVNPRLHDAPSFLFRMGDEGSAIYGNRPLTSTRDVESLLGELEAHIATVQQKYLQGHYESLAEYNDAAGDVSEPFRFVLLYWPEDVLGESADRQLIQRLRKIAGAGRRCGVFILAVSSAPPSHAVRTALSALPAVTSSDKLDESWAAQVIGSDGRLPKDFTDGRISATLRWVVQVWSEPTRAVVEKVQNDLLTALAGAGRVEVTPTQAFELAHRAHGRRRGRGGDLVAANPGTPKTWWAASSQDGLHALLGRSGAQDVATLDLDSGLHPHALVGGLPGSGKSQWLHAVLMSLVTSYAPDELELYLVDFKEGVEFRDYAKLRLPHARVVAIDSDREFGLSVLESLTKELESRGEIFKAAGSQITSLAAYRESSGEVMPRVLLVLDEFQRLFGEDDRTSHAAGSLLDTLIRQGRAFGVHVLLASQTIAGNAGLPRHTLQQVPTRVSLKTSPDDARLLMREDNVAAVGDMRPGEGILNESGGDPVANIRFQTTYWSGSDRERVLVELAGRHRPKSARTTVFDGQGSVDSTDLEQIRGPGTSRRDEVCFGIGVPFTVGHPLTVRLRREPGAHVLVVAEGADAELWHIGAQMRRDGIAVDVAVHGATDPSAGQLQALVDAGANVAERRSADDLLRSTAEMVAERHELQDYAAPQRILLIPHLTRCRALDPTAYDNEIANLLTAVLQDGPDVGVHVVMAVDRPASVERRLSSAMLRNIAVRVVSRMSRDDAYRLADSDLPTRLRSHQLYLEDSNTGVSGRLQRLSMWSAQEVASVARGTS